MKSHLYKVLKIISALQQALKAKKLFSINLRSFFILQVLWRHVTKVYPAYNQKVNE